jgi:hypothetical protein
VCGGPEKTTIGVIPKRAQTADVQPKFRVLWLGFIGSKFVKITRLKR